MKSIYSGKVREIYDVSDDRLVIVTTDRISAFDRILPQMIKGKGIVLNTLSNFWFEKTKRIVPNHIISDKPEDMPDFFQKEAFQKRTVLVKKLDMLPFEFVMRGYIFGSMWNSYRQGLDFCGHRIPAGYKQAQKLKTPILTPAIKRDAGHDEYIDVAYVTDKLGRETVQRITDICFRLYCTCADYALSKGIIIADAKFELETHNFTGVYHTS